MLIEDGGVTVVLRQSVKRGGERIATYETQYPDLADAIGAVRQDGAEGRVENVSVAVRLR